MQRKTFFITVSIIIIISIIIAVFLPVPAHTHDSLFIVDYEVYYKDHDDSTYHLGDCNQAIIKATSKTEAYKKFNDSVPLNYDCDSIHAQIDYKIALLR
jgi:hypothetical protein